jgi:hypothetical protein
MELILTMLMVVLLAIPAAVWYITKKIEESSNRIIEERDKQPFPVSMSTSVPLPINSITGEVMQDNTSGSGVASNNITVNNHPGTVGPTGETGPEGTHAIGAMTFSFQGDFAPEEEEDEERPPRPDRWENLT